MRWSCAAWSSGSTSSETDRTVLRDRGGATRDPHRWRLTTRGHPRPGADRGSRRRGGGPPRRDREALRPSMAPRGSRSTGSARLAERRLEAIAALQAERDGLRHEVDRNRGSVAGLETRLIGADIRGGDLERELERARRDASAAAERLTGDWLSAEREAVASTATAGRSVARGRGPGDRASPSGPSRPSQRSGARSREREGLRGAQGGRRRGRSGGRRAERRRGAPGRRGGAGRRGAALHPSRPRNGRSRQPDWLTSKRSFSVSLDMRESP